jgi:formylglycine-generating enzyme required for sulfatase activity
VTAKQYRRFNPTYPYAYDGDPDGPLAGVTWYDAAAYCNWLSQQDGIPSEQWCYAPNADGKYADGMTIKSNFVELTGYRLPTEAEWELACRAGALTGYFYGQSEELLTEYAWVFENSQERAWGVGRLEPNDLGLSDMHGNAWCWCQDRIETSKLPKSKLGEERQPAETIRDNRHTALRGGSFNTKARRARAANNGGCVVANRIGDNGFRPVRTYR